MRRFKTSTDEDLCGMPVSVEAARREMSAALIDLFKLRSALFLEKVEKCATSLELRQAVFMIIEETRATDPEKSRQLLRAWDILDHL